MKVFATTAAAALLLLLSSPLQSASAACVAGDTGVPFSECETCEEWGAANYCKGSGPNELACVDGLGLVPSTGVCACSDNSVCTSTGNLTSEECPCPKPCYPPHAQVLMADRSTRSMSDLQIGDKVLAADASGALAEDEVYFFGHRDNTKLTTFVVLKMASGAKLEVSANHFVPTAAGMRLAGSIKAGDVVASLEHAADEVVAVGELKTPGFHSPYTLSGNLVVDGVVASSHADWNHPLAVDSVVPEAWRPAAYQAFMAPLRAAYHVLPRDAYLKLVGDNVIEAGEKQGFAAAVYLALSSAVSA